VLCEEGGPYTKVPGRKLIDGYRLFLLIRGNGCYEGVRYSLWAGKRETRLWLDVRGNRWQPALELRKALSPLEHETPQLLIVSSNGKLRVPLTLPMGKERDTVLFELTEQIRTVTDLLPDHSANAAKVPAPEME
jgi:hypothetical protein